MPRNLDSLVRSSTTRIDGVPERVSGRTTRVSLLAWEFLLAVVLLPGAAAVFSGDLLGPQGLSHDRVALVGHTHLVEMVTFSPDGRSLASCGWDNTVRIWDVDRWTNGGEAEPVTLPHDSVRFATAFSPDGSLLASAGEGSLTIWSCRPGYQPRVERAGSTYRCLAFSPDGHTLALGGEDATIRLWDMPSARERMVLRSHADVVKCIAFSPDGRLLVSSSQEGRVVLWDAIRGAEVHTLVNGGPDPVRFVAFSPDGRTLGMSEVAWGPRDLILFDVETGAIRTRLTGHRFGANALAFSPDGLTLATAGVDRCIKLWDLTTGKELTTLSDHVGWVKSLAFSPDGGRLAYSGSDATIGLWDLERQRPHPAGPLSSHATGTKVGT